MRGSLHTHNQDRAELRSLQLLRNLGMRGQASNLLHKDLASELLKSMGVGAQWFLAPLQEESQPLQECTA